MSSTRTTKSAERPGGKHDYYRTPVPVVTRALHIMLTYDLLPKKAATHSRFRILDPCAGGDPEHPTMPYPEGIRQTLVPVMDIVMHTMDVRPDSSAETKADFLKCAPGYSRRSGHGRYDLIISNPPFPLAVDMVDHAFDHWLTDGGKVVFLQRLNWLGSKARNDFWEHRTPEALIYEPNRIPFGLPESKQTDSIEYGHFVFARGYREETRMIRAPWGSHKEKQR